MHEEVFTWVLWLVRDHGLLVGKTLGVDSTTLEASCQETVGHCPIAGRGGGTRARPRLRSRPWNDAERSGVAREIPERLTRLTRLLRRRGELGLPASEIESVAMVEPVRAARTLPSEERPDLEQAPLAGVQAGEAECP